ncbi:Retrovirus-related Pol polyprotein from transposon TNT 1-94 [Vitis vinifera]|uniref:Retrovirus-related Pol polyprotein from transposon TNT 1-94 n=1 Tax=Vitis vinifera TaxID=29760 RepID=A0A438C3J5_VITVI|nr:Retrovirus-related Pol polyprotein from transposon TNT 1-94 [Vitis vinifera]
MAELTTMKYDGQKAIDIFEMFITKVERQLDKNIKIVRSDRCGEYYGRYDELGQNPGLFAKFLEKRGIRAQYTMPGTPQQNGVVERRNHTLMEMVRSMMSYSSVPISLWGETLKTAMYILNRVSGKLDSRTISGYFIGYPDKSKRYRFYCPNHSVRIIETGNARFLENGEISESNEPRKVDIEEIRVDIPPPFLPQEIIAPQPAQQVEEHEQHNRDGSLPRENIAIENAVEPPQPETFDCKLVRCKWVFKTKRDAKGNIKQFKARLVVKGFTQKEGIDYRDTFSSVSKKDSLRIIMALVAHFDLELHQMDVKTAFLNGNLDEDIYMEQPEGRKESK